jgi:hypothetical protein
MIAAVVLLGLACAVWWTNRHPSTSASKNTPISPQLADVPENQITQIDLQKMGAGTLEIKRQNGKWVITQPHTWPADQDAVNSLASSLNPLLADSIVDATPSGLSQYGLAQPSLTVTVHEKNGQTVQLFFGDDVPAGSLVYARVPNKPDIYAVSSSVKTTFDKTANDLRDKRLLTFDSNGLTRLELISSQGDIEFGKNSRNDWEILKPGPYRADGSQVDDLVRNLSNAKMDLSAADAESAKAASAFSSGKPDATVKVSDSSGTETLEVRKNGSDYYAKSSVVPGVYKVAADLGTAIDKPVNDFRNKKIFDFGFDDPNRIVIQRSSGERTFERSGMDWKSGGKTMDPAAVQSLIDKLRDLTATKFETTGFTAPEDTITVASDGGKRVEKVEFCKTSSGYLARGENEPNTLYALDASSVNDILSASDAIKPAASSRK